MRHLVLILTLTLLLAACGSTPSPSGSVPPTPGPASSPTASPASPSAAPVESPDPSPASTPEPTATSAPTASPAPTTAAGIPTDSIARVVTSDLRVRSKPRVSDDSDLLKPLLQQDQLVYVVEGPVRASGYQWYLVRPFSPEQPFAPQPFGWVAAGGDGETWLDGTAFDCPAAPDSFASFYAIPPLVELACFGGRSFTFRARIGSPEATCGVDPGWTVRPEWLGSTCPHNDFLLAPKGPVTQGPDAVFDPKLADTRPHAGEFPDTVDVRITVRRDHPAAQRCHAWSYDPANIPAGITAPELVLGCRAQDVIVKVERV